MDTYWQKQTDNKPLFGDLIWSRPQHKVAAGKLLIVGGNSHSFVEVNAAFSAATKAGIGTIRLLLPDSLQKKVGGFLDAEFAPTTPSGGFGNDALASALDLAGWADGVLLAGDFSKNSETTIFLDKFITKYNGLLTLCGDSLDNLAPYSLAVFKRAQTCIVPSLRQLQLMVSAAKFKNPIKLEVDLIKTVEVFHELTKAFPVHMLLPVNNQVIVASHGAVVTTNFNEKPAKNVNLAASGAVWWLQNPAKPLEALTCAVYEMLTIRG